VRAPEYISFSNLKDIIQKRISWFRRKLNEQADLIYLAFGKTYCRNEIHYVAGKPYRLDLKKDRRACVRLSGNQLILQVTDPNDPDKVKRTLYSWYREMAEREIAPRVAMIMNKLSEFGLPDPRLGFRTMKRRWGSCSRDHEITLNTELVKVPLICCDYVIYHEIAHLRYHDHSCDYYNFLKVIYPDADRGRTELDKFRV